MAIWTGDEQESFEAVLDGFKKLYPNVDRQVHVGGRQPRAAPLDRGRGRQPARHRARSPQPGLMRRLRRAGRAQADRRSRRRSSTNFASRWLEVGTVDGTLYGVLFKGANKSTIWYNVAAFEDAGVEPPEDVGRAARGREDAQGRRASRRTRSAATTAGRSPTCSRTSTSARPARRSTTSCRRTRSRGPTRP